MIASQSQVLTLAPFQREGASFLAARPFAILGDGTGLGKTPQAITALESLNLERFRVLILAPLSTAEGWRREVHRWSWLNPPTIVRRSDPLPVAGEVNRLFSALSPPSERPSAPESLTLLPWTDLAVRMPGWERAGIPLFDLIIADECQCLRCPDSLTSQAFLRLAEHASRIWALSATPMPNGRPIELLTLLRAFRLLDKTGWVERYKRTFCYRPCPNAPQGFDFLGSMHLDLWAQWLRKSDIMLRRTAEDVPGQLPPLRRVVVPLACGPDDPMPTEVAELIARTLTRMGTNVSQDGDTNPDGTDPGFEAMSQYRHQLGLRKVPKIIEWLRERGSGPLVVFTHHQSTARALGEAFPGSPVITGADDPALRQQTVDAWASNPSAHHLLIATVGAAGTGLNGLHLRTGEAAIVEGCWEPGLLDQAEGRVRRIGGAASMSIIHYLVAADCLDERIQSTVERKRAYIAQALDTHS